MNPRKHTHLDSPQDWNVLRTLCLFRTLLCLLLIYIQPPNQFLFASEHWAPEPLLLVSGAYIFSSLLLTTLLWGRIPGFEAQVAANVICDLIFIGTLVLLVDGLTQTVAILLCVPLAASVLLRRPRLLYLLATIAAAILFFAEQTSPGGQQNTYATLALSLAFFAIAQLSVLHVRRMHQADTTLREQEQKLTSLNNLAGEILDASTQGLIVLDQQNNVRFINATALMLLSSDDQPLPTPLSALSPHVNDAHLTQAEFVDDEDGTPLLRIHTTQLRGNNTLIALMDLREIESMTEQVRLASLGRWSASVAHEIRNPLSAISQALQLTDDVESQSELNHLLQIIGRNTNRIDAVVTDVLTLSRPTASRQTTALSSWLDGYSKELQLANPQARVNYHNNAAGAALIQCDDKRLYHIVSNLCQNALAHGDDGDVQIELCTLMVADSITHELTVSNRGAALTTAQQNRMFEPFFTTSTRGSGLGLFVVHELCEQLGFYLAYEFTDGSHKMTLSTPDIGSYKAAA